MAIDAPTGRGPTHAVGAGDLDDTLPELEPAHGPYASWSRRVVASLLDTAIAATVLFLAVGPAYEVAWIPTISFGVSTEAPVPGGGWWAFGTAAALLALQAWTGATPGKRTVGIVVVHDATGRPAGLVRTSCGAWRTSSTRCSTSASSAPCGTRSAARSPTRCAAPSCSGACDRPSRSSARAPASAARRRRAS
nr:RDD family protein [Cellulosimicrobium sp. MM]